MNYYMSKLSGKFYLMIIVFFNLEENGSNHIIHFIFILILRNRIIYLVLNLN